MEDVILLYISSVPFFLAFDYSLRERAVNGKNNITYLTLFGTRTEKSS